MSSSAESETANRSPIVAAIIVKEATSSSPPLCSIATFNKQSRELSVCEFSDNGGANQLPVLESILLQLQPSEVCAFVHNHAGLARVVSEIVTSCPVYFMTSAPSNIDDGLVESDLVRLLPKTTVGLSSCPAFKSELVRKAFLSLIGQFRILSKSENFNACTLVEFPTDGVYLRLDRASFNALNLFAKGVGASCSLFGLLNKCKTRMGSRRLEQWIRQPLVDSMVIKDRHDVVETLAGSARVRHSIQAQRLARIPDLDLIKVKLGNGTSSLEDLVKVYEGIVAVNCLIDDFKPLGETVSRVFVVPLEKLVGQLEGFMRLLETTLDLNMASSGVFRIDAKFDPSLGELGQQRDSVQGRMEKLRLSVARKAGVDNLKISECLQPYGMGFRVVRKSMQAIQALGSKYKQVQINKAEYLFTCQELVELVDELKTIEAEYDKKSSQVLRKIISVASSYYGVLSGLSDLIGQLDVLNAFAVAAVTWRLVRPKLAVDGNRGLILKNCRHLLVEVRAAETGARDYIPNNVEMSTEGNMQVITGPNMGGKSTYIRSVGLCVLMNQIGCFVPCDAGSQLPIFNSIMCRVGASDAQVRGISTFMQEMIEAGCIVNAANDKSLVIIDELGRGTSTQDGFGLAWAVSKYLKEESKSYVLFATHFHELAKLPGAKNRHVAALVDDKGLTLLYEVRDGPTSNSFGTNVAELAGFPKDVIQNAIEREKMMMGGERMMIDV